MERRYEVQRRGDYFEIGYNCSEVKDWMDIVTFTSEWPAQSAAQQFQEWYDAGWMV